MEYIFICYILIWLIVYQIFLNVSTGVVLNGPIN